MIKKMHTVCAVQRVSFLLKDYSVFCKPILCLADGGEMM